MKFLVMSDTHDHLWKLEATAAYMELAEAVIHCGDICSPFMIRRLGELSGDRPVHVVWGNNDGDTFLIGKVASGFPNVQLHGALAQIQAGGRVVAVNHYPEIAVGLARSGMYSVVCYGHDHILHEERVGECLLLNPGELLGMKGRSTVAMFDTADLSVRWIDL
ncbi:MAG TPA: YfcE family phosphodiesterase [Anaerolineales bacterium]|nr:YfcE family phosphodiesterase [Anaerolineales bacterium]